MYVPEASLATATDGYVDGTKLDLTDVPDHAGISCVDDLLVDEEEERGRGKGISQGEACFFI